jgi:hypothetical protein
VRQRLLKLWSTRESTRLARFSVTPDAEKLLSCVFGFDGAMFGSGQ